MHAHATKRACWLAHDYVLQSEMVLTENRLLGHYPSLEITGWDSARAHSPWQGAILLANVSHAKVGRAALYSRLPQSACTYRTYLMLQFEAGAYAGK